MEITALEAEHLAGLIEQFIELVSDSRTEPASESMGVEALPLDDDPAVRRLVPDAYPDDSVASGEFRRLTASELLDRREQDAALVLASLTSAVDALDEHQPATATMLLALDDQAVSAWMKTLTALRLVLASRLGIRTEADSDPEDPRFGVYEWLGYRLEGLLTATEPRG